MNARNRPLSLLMEELLLDWQSLSWPVPWAEVFREEELPKTADPSSPRPLVLEIGFGNGEFLIEQAQKNPNSGFLGIEVSWTSVQHLLKRIDSSQLKNIRILQGSATAILESLFARDSLSEVFLNFPDPWRKDRHSSRRFVQRETMELVADRLQPGGRITIATDHAPYAEWIREILTSQDLLQSHFDTASVDELPGRNPTKYERKALAASTRIHYYVWEKRTSPARTFLPLETLEMPNVILRPSRPAFGEPTTSSNLSGECFAPQTWQEEDRGVRVVVKLMKSYVEDDGNHLLEVLVKEGNLSQHFGILLLSRERGDLLLKLSGLGQPRPTWGVKRSVYHLARRILAFHPDMEVVSSTVGALAEEMVEG